jgi:hypothetical protein
MPRRPLPAAQGRDERLFTVAARSDLILPILTLITCSN